MSDSPAQRPTVTERRRCFARLHLASTATEQDVNEAYRRLAAKCHPDAGGNAEEFHALQSAYRECLQLVTTQPQISGKPSSDSFSPSLPAGWLSGVRLRYSLLALACILPCVATLDRRIAIAASLFLGPLVLGALLAQLPGGIALFTTGLVLLATGLGWMVALSRVGWISYAFASVPAVGGGPEFEAAVDLDKRLMLIAAFFGTVFLCFCVVVGCLASVTRSRG